MCVCGIIIVEDHCLTLTITQLKNYALLDIERIMRSCGSSLAKFSKMPFLDGDIVDMRQNVLLDDELSYDPETESAEHPRLLPKLTVEQRGVYDKILARCC